MMLPQKPSDSRLQTLCLVFLSCVAATFLIYWLRPVLVPLVVALFVVSGVTPILAALERRLGLSRIAAAGLTFLAGVVVLVIFGCTIWVSLLDLSNNAEAYRRRVRELVLEIEETFPFNLSQPGSLKTLAVDSGSSAGSDEREIGTLPSPASESLEVASFGDSEELESRNDGSEATSRASTLPPGESGSQSRRGTSPAATASDPAASGRVKANSATSKSDGEPDGASENAEPEPSVGLVLPSANLLDGDPDRRGIGRTVGAEVANSLSRDLESSLSRSRAEEAALEEEKLARASQFVDSFVRAGIAAVSQTLVSLVSTSVVVLIYVFFLLIGTPSIHNSPAVREMDHQVRSYLSLKTVISIFTGLAFGLALRAFGVPMALAFGVLAFLLNFVPNVGPIVASLLPIPLIILDPTGSIGWMVSAITVICTIQLISGNIVEPKIMGDKSDLHPVTILLALMFWGMMWGVIGMFLATPITSAMKLMLERFESTLPIANLMAGRWGEPTDAEAPGSESSASETA